MSKIMALDLGDAWTGVALTDTSGTFARPYTTVATQDLQSFLTNTLSCEQVKTIVIGYPCTMKGGESIQTHKIIAQSDQLKEAFPEKEFVLWDERLSSKRAQALASKKRSREEKLKEHSRAAAFILDSYISFLQTRAGNSTIKVDRLE
jgi:putative holliday junction resolvase